MKMLGYSAMGVGNIDAHLGDVFYAAAKERGIQVIEAGPNQPAGVVPYIVKKINGVKVGVISFGSEEAQSMAEAKSLDILKSRYVAFREARKASDVLILLDASVSRQAREDMRSAIYDLELERGAVVAVTISTRDEWNSPLMSVSPYHKNVEREGVVL